MITVAMQIAPQQSNGSEVTIMNCVKTQDTPQRATPRRQYDVDTRTLSFRGRLAMNLREDVTKDDQGREGRRSSVSFGNALGPVLQ